MESPSLVSCLWLVKRKSTFGNGSVTLTSYSVEISFIYYTHFIRGVRKLYQNRYLHTIDIVDEYARFEFTDGSLSLVINLMKYEESR